jgi:hypothetical protein
MTHIKNTTKRKFGDRQLQEICQYINRLYMLKKLYVPSNFEILEVSVC